MSVFNPENVFDQFDDLIPGAADHGESYQRTLARYVREHRVPVELDVREERLAGGFRAPSHLFVVMTPTDRRLHRYPSYHFAAPLGTSLKVGWYLVGQMAAKGLGGWAVLGGATQNAMDELGSLIQLIHESSVVPAMHETAAAAGFGPTSSTPRQGLFGT